MRFQPGQSGNPKGKAKGTPSMKGLLNRKKNLAHLFMDTAEEEWPKIVRKLFDLAEKGSHKAISTILDHGLIKTTQIIDQDEEVRDSKNMSKEEIINMIQTIRNERDAYLKEKSAE